MKIKYFAEDGTEHYSEKECNEYEKYQKANVEKRLKEDFKMRSGESNLSSVLPYSKFTAFYIKTLDEFRNISLYLQKQNRFCSAAKETEFNKEGWYLFATSGGTYCYGLTNVYSLDAIKKAYGSFIEQFE